MDNECGDEMDRSDIDWHAVVKVDPERKERICRLSESQSHIALLAIAEIIFDSCNCDTVSFEKALDIAETF